MLICLTPSVHNTAAPFSVSEFLKKHETKFFEVVNPRLRLLRLRRKGVITEDVSSSIDNTNIEDAQEILYHHLTHHASEDTLREYCKVAIDAVGFPNMQALGKKMMEELPQGGWLELIMSMCTNTCMGNARIRIS